jgi:beta-glucosidase
MCAYNRIDGQPACASDLLLKEHLRGAWGFTGYVVSDCDAVKDISDNHKYAPDAAAAVAAAMRTGVDNECNGATLGRPAGLGERYREALERGLITDRGHRPGADPAVLGAAEATATCPASARPDLEPAAIGAPGAMAALALDAAEKSLVLLKNDGTLPLRSGHAHRGDRSARRRDARAARQLFRADLRPADLGAGRPAPGDALGA